MRDVDYHGTLLNVVARATKSAPPSGVVVTPVVLDRAPAIEGFIVEMPPRHALRGVDEPIDLAVLRRSGPIS